MYTFKKDVITISKNTITYFSNKADIKSNHLRIRYNQSENHRLGIIIPKKIIPLSVTRNTLRRKIRGLFRDNKSSDHSYEVLLTITLKIQAEKKTINDILMREWISLLNQLH